MKMFQPLLAACAIALLLASGTAEARRPVVSAPASSEAKSGLGRGDTELGFFLDYQHLDGSGSNTLALGVVWGKYLRDTVEMRVTPVVTYLDAGGLKNFGFNPYVTVEKLFPNGTHVVPYVGGGIGLNIGTGSGTVAGTSFTTSDLGVFVTPVGGVKFFISERMALEYALGFQVGFDYNCVDSGGFSTCNSGSKTEFHNDLRFNVYF